MKTYCLSAFLCMCGCSFEDYKPSSDRYITLCLRGVEYWAEDYRAAIAPAFRPDGTLYTCEGDTE